ncbi:hypothetical protein SD78_4152 [Bacillus badius]|nr:hypothetical protein SD78_4152 [Bacillus badius]
MRSSSTVKGYLDKLKREGYVTWNEGMPRTLRIEEKKLLLFANKKSPSHSRGAQSVDNPLFQKVI